MKYFTVLVLLLLVLVRSAGQAIGSMEGHSAYIDVSTNGFETGDTMLLELQYHYLNELLSYGFPGEIKSATLDSNFSCSFKIPNLENPIYISIGKGYVKNSTIIKPIIKNYLLSPGDSLTVSLGKAKELDPEWFCPDIRFTGIGSSKFSMMNEIERRRASYTINKDSSALWTRLSIEKSAIKHGLAFADTVYKKNNQILEVYRSRISSTEYDILKADIEGDYWLKKGDALFRFMNLNKDQLDPFLFPLRIAYMQQFPFYETKSGNPLSKSLPASIVKYFKYSNDFILDKKNSTAIYEIINKNYSGAMREKLLTIYLLDKRYRLDSSIKRYYHSILPRFDNKFYKSACLAALDKYAKGSIIPNFSMKDEKDSIHRLTDYRGKIVLLDFWYVGCPPCAALYKNCLSKLELLYRDEPFVVVSVNIDTNKEKWQKSIGKEIYTSSLAHNLNIGSLGKRHPLIESLEISAYPFLLLLDKKGNVLESDKQILGNFEKIKNLIKANF